VGVWQWSLTPKLAKLRIIKLKFIMNTETVIVLPKGEDFQIIVQHDQSGSAYGITISKNAYEQLRQHFVSGRSEQLVCDVCESTDDVQTYCGKCMEERC
jgi:hypothetical protein